MGEYLMLKWGTLKGWDCDGNEKMLEALQRWDGEGSSLSTMTQHDTDTQKEAICDAIDACNGEITNDWSGEKMTKEDAKAYVRDYRR